MKYVGATTEQDYSRCRDGQMSLSFVLPIEVERERKLINHRNQEEKNEEGILAGSLQ